MSIITVVTNFVKPVAKWVSLEGVNEKLIAKIPSPSSFFRFNWLGSRPTFEYIEPSSIIQKKRTQSEICIKPGSLTRFHQNLLFRTTLKQRSFRNLSQVQMRTYCTQERKTVRDMINAGRSAWVNTGIMVKITGGGVLVLLFAAIVGWTYCESHPDEETCESGRTLLGIKKKINRIPVSASHCILRKVPIEKIQSLFSASKEDDLIVAIIGDPASGKTELSKQYAREYKNSYHHIWFVQVETWEKAYRDLAVEWKLFDDQEITLMGGIEKINMDLIIAKVHHSFTYLGRKKSLIIFDNASKGFINNQLKGQLPTHTDILVTSRSSDWGTTLNLSSDKSCGLTLDEGVGILRNWVEEEQWSHAEAEKIVLRFNFLPLPIAQAGHYLYKTKAKLGKYLPLFEKNKQRVLKGGMLEGDIDIIVSLKIAIDQVKTEGSDALKLLHYCALLPSKNIPRELLEKLFDANKLNEYISTVDTLILADATNVSMHDLFQEIIVEQMSSQKKELLSDLGKVSDGFKEFLLKHPKKALPIFQQSLEDHEKRIRPDERKIGDILDDLGKICNSLGNYHLSLEYEKKAVEIREKVLGKEHPDTAMSYNNIGLIFGDLGRYEEALEWAKKALEIREKVLGKEHLDTAMSYNNIGASLEKLGRYKEALEWLKKSLEISEKVLGKEHPNTAVGYNNIGMILGDLNQHKEALERVKKASEIREKALGKEHPKTATSYNNIGVILRDSGRPLEALEWAKKALVIREKVLEKEHSDIAMSNNNIGLCLGDLGRHEEALEHFQKAIQISCKAYKDKNPIHERYFKNLVQSLNQQPELKQCEKIKEGMLVLCIEKFGNNDPLVPLLQEACSK